MNLHLDEYGFLWHHPPSIPITGAVQQQRDRDAARAQEQAQKAQTTTRPDQTEGEPEATAPAQGSQEGPGIQIEKAA